MLLIHMLLFFQAADGLAWAQLIQFGPTVVLLALVLWFLIRMAPMWKEIKLREMELRSEENGVKREQASALGQLAEALQSIAVEQRKATEEVGIMQRMNADSSDNLSSNVKALTQRVDVIQKQIGEGRLSESAAAH